MTPSERVAVALSGGVDSSVAAALLVKQGYDVMGMMLKLWSMPGKEEENRCCAPEAMDQARQVAALLDIPFYVIDAREIFHKTVVSMFINGYTHGITPNPCLTCNRLVRWDFLLNQALAYGADLLATGHYTRLLTEESGLRRLLRGVDEKKDQSYVLHTLHQDQLKHSIFPVGGYQKFQVRQIAQEFGLPVANRSESQDLCFIADRNYHQFLLHYAPEQAHPGPIVSINGEVIGHHKGLAFYTIGQRKGLGIAHPTPFYVVGKDTKSNALMVGSKEDLGKDELTAKQVNWISGLAPQSPISAVVKIRYHGNDLPTTITPLPDHTAHILFQDPVQGVTPGQAVVFYEGDFCLGGGIINA